MRYRNNYKEYDAERIMRRGQIAVWVIIAIVIVVAVLVVALYPRISQSLTGVSVSNPQEYLTSCLDDVLHEKIQDITTKGGYENPEGALLFNGTKIKYLCYTSEYYTPCIVQQPFIKEQIEGELNRLIDSEISSCLDTFAEQAGRRGYQVTRGSLSHSVSLIPGQIQVNLDVPITMTSDTSRTFNQFTLSYPSQYYDLAIIATSIVSYEATYGNSEITNYMQYYPDLRISKIKLGEGSTVYVVENTETGEKYTFASRSLVWPAGYPEEEFQ